MPVEMMSAAPRASANGTAVAARERARRGGWTRGCTNGVGPPVEGTGEEADGPGMVRRVVAVRYHRVVDEGGAGVAEAGVAGLVLAGSRRAERACRRRRASGDHQTAAHVEAP